MLSDSPTHTQSPLRDAEYFKSRDNEESLLDSDSDAPGEYEELDTIGLTDFLDFDPKPTLVFDLLRHNAFEDNLEAVFTNKAFRSNIHFTSAIPRNSEPTSPILYPEEPPYTNIQISNQGFHSKTIEVEFRDLMFSDRSHSQRGTSSTTFSDKTVAALKDVQVSNSNSAASGAQKENLTMSDIATTPCPDITAESPIGYLSDHTKLIRNFDWSSTPLGPMDSWSPEFRQIVNLVMANPHPVALFWGEELTVLYNEKYSETVAFQKHPQLMGTGARGPFSEVWEEVGEIFNSCRRTGQGVAMTDQMLSILRRGFMEETFFSWALTPIWKSGNTPELLGLYNAPFETTGKVINNRRMRTLLRNDTTSSRGSISSDSSTSIKSVILEGSLGVPEGHPSAQTRLDLKRHLGGYVPALREAMKTRQPSLLSLSDSMLPVGLTQGYNWQRGYGEPCRDAVTLGQLPSLSHTFQDEIRRGNNAAEVAAAERLGLYEELALQKSRLQRIAEVSPVEILPPKCLGMDRIAPSSIPTMVKGWEKLTVHNQPWSGELQLIKPWFAKEMEERAELSEELLLRTNQANEIKRNFKRFSDLAPGGLAILDPDGVLTYANEQWFSISGLSKTETLSEIPFSWVAAIGDLDRPKFTSKWAELISQNTTIVIETRMGNPWVGNIAGSTLTIQRWVLATFSPELDENGNLKSVMGCSTDISRIKWAEDLQDRRLKDYKLLHRYYESRNAKPT
ncbi:hypothetical protein DID88_005341 [Monilinia fructigena]|uniref:PAS domain-containing protein n=1 Tax=Monilinia fructigena TaxID=38457 RepID=A0A395IZI5_9HELO|nr:hypothetical protein DID88_005341 [Monilinia fructigena]